MFIIKVREGQSVQVGDRVITAAQVIRPGLVKVEIDGEPEPVLVSWDRKLTILPGVTITVHRVVCFSEKITLLFAAPRSVRIRELPYEPAE